MGAAADAIDKQHVWQNQFAYRQSPAGSLEGTAGKRAVQPGVLSSENSPTLGPDVIARHAFLSG